jgi:hypothetical protein
MCGALIMTDGISARVKLLQRLCEDCVKRDICALFLFFF